jgi:hypothetical protein
VRAWQYLPTHNAHCFFVLLHTEKLYTMVDVERVVRLDFHLKR